MLEQLQREDAAEALRELERYRYERGVFDTLAPVLMGLWAKTDPRAALEHSLTDLPADNTRGMSLEYVCRAWAEQDPVAAWTWFRETTDSSQFPVAQSTWKWLAKGIFAEWVARDTAGAFSQLARLSFADQELAIFGIAAAANEPDLRPAILTAITSLPDEGQKRRVVAKVAAGWARLEPEAAAQWTASLSFENPSARLQAVVEVAGEWWRLDPHATVRWLPALPAGELRTRVLGEAVAAWAAKQPSEAIQWLDASNLDRNERGSIEEQIARYLFHEDHQRTADWLLSRADSSTRRNDRLEMIVNLWAHWDPTACGQWLIAHGLDTDASRAMRTYADTVARDFRVEAVAWARSIPDEATRERALAQLEAKLRERYPNRVDELLRGEAIESSP